MYEFTLENSRNYWVSCYMGFRLFVCTLVIARREPDYKMDSDFLFLFFDKRKWILIKGMKLFHYLSSFLWRKELYFTLDS